MKPEEKVTSHIEKSYKDEEVIMLNEDNKQVIIFPMKNKFECIGAIETTRDMKAVLWKLNLLSF